MISARQQRSPAPDAWGPRTTTGGAFGGGAFGGGTTDARRGRDAPDGRHPARGAARGRGRAPSSSFFPGSSGRYGDTYGDGTDGYGDYGSDASERGAGPRGRGRWAPPGTYPGWGPGRQSGRGGGHQQLDGEDYRVRNAPRALKGLVREQVQSVADLASLAAAMGYGLTPLPCSEGDAYSLGDPAFDDRWEAPVLSMTGSDGRLLANNGQLIQCHICSENHFKADRPKLDVLPCHHCNGVDHTLRSCPDAPPALLRRVRHGRLLRLTSGRAWVSRDGPM